RPTGTVAQPPARRRREWILARGEGRKLATKGTKSTKGRTTDLDLPFVLFVPFVANFLPSPLGYGLSNSPDRPWLRFKCFLCSFLLSLSDLSPTLFQKVTRSWAWNWRAPVMF